MRNGRVGSSNWMESTRFTECSSLEGFLLPFFSIRKMA